MTAAMNDTFYLVHREPGAIRNDIPIWATHPGAVKLGNRTATPELTKVDGVPGAFTISNVLTPEESKKLLDISENMGYTEDAPVSLGRNIRHNENCVWIADAELNDAIFERMRPWLPEEVLGGKLLGMNRRWRLYKYGEKDVFKTHTDGSWPGSGIVNGQYMTDMYGDRWSQMTVVIYLNDDFTGGETKFYIPDKTPLSQGHSQYTAGEPSAGGALIFFHGDHELSPLHEGSLVTSGCKYIIRTDILYKLEPQAADAQGSWLDRYLTGELGNQ